MGALEETITVSGQTPLVDVTQATRTQVLTRDLIDALPSTRNIMSVGMMVPGIRLGTPDVGGSRQMEQTNPRGHGIAAKHTVQHIDGMSVNSQETSNQQSYINDALSAEVTVSTSAHPAEIQSGGLRTNMIPKDGGNIVSGSIFFGGTDGNWQSDNVSEEMKRQNFTSANGIAHVQNFNGSMGGPIHRDKLWFFISARHISTDEVVGNVAGAYHRAGWRVHHQHPRPVHPRRAGTRDVADQPEEQAGRLLRAHVEAERARTSASAPTRAPERSAIHIMRTMGWDKASSRAR